MKMGCDAFLRLSFGRLTHDLGFYHFTLFYSVLLFYFYIMFVLSSQIIQIYFPYSSQLYPDEFPGPSLFDCPERIGRSGADHLGCANHDYPDTYGNYRTAKLSQVKHHWWWKVNETEQLVFKIEKFVGQLNNFAGTFQRAFVRQEESCSRFKFAGSEGEN